MTSGPPDLRATSAYDYALPPGRIARYPAERRDGSRLLAFPRLAVDEGAPSDEVAEVAFQDQRFSDLPSLLADGDLLVLNESRVLPARLLGRKPTGAECEILLLRPIGEGSAGRWEALVRPGSKLKPGRRVEVSETLTVVVEESLPGGSRVVRLEADGPIDEAIERHGRIPLPPYLDRDEEPLDRERYQTVYARDAGSVAAPTAGLHFTPELLDRIQARGVGVAKVCLHVGPGTFRPVDTESIGAHTMHREDWQVSTEAALAIRNARDRGGRVWAVGTTVVRTLESAAGEGGDVEPGHRSTELFIGPGFRFRVVDGLITNFHLPRSTLLILVATFAGYRRTLAAYEHAIRTGYRFYSYGDAMAVTPTKPPTGKGRG